MDPPQFKFEALPACPEAISSHGPGATSNDDESEINSNSGDGDESNDGGDESSDDGDKRKDKTGYLHPKLNPVLEERLRSMKDFLVLFTDLNNTSNWGKAALQTANLLERGEYLTCCLCQWTKAYIQDRKNLTLRQQNHTISRIEDKELAAEIKLHLQSLGKYIRALDIVHYLDDPIVWNHHGFKKSIAISTAQRWLQKLGYGWKKRRGGSISMVTNVTMSSIIAKMYFCLHGEASKPTCHIVVWFHDESTFYANDCRKVRWEHIEEDALPQPKGEGALLMVAHFVSADYGFLQSPDGKESAQVLFKAGKLHDGYYSSNEILKHAACAMNILEKHYQNEDHILVFDNATTHVKHADDALSARPMPKKPSKTWDVDVTVTDDNGKPLMHSDGKPAKKKIPMAPGCLRNGTPQLLYFPEGHPQARWYKGMEQILQERGYDTKGLLAESKGFKCKAGQKDCCCC
ncbi:uncharacterized protein EDB91DRAFT_1244190 [Suillus paluster]|uniref:uncharacterized protein n=1 Tax=Suillus paluster TaxID=48578 RepID=UPI001B886ACC|nr:uncharacterized protein EDB91DRAFT_1244190 [Suillus paluster]KAG1750611.1 hypothetical protein EDB91DRAFT_1244190 [Suillus paluster]